MVKDTINAINDSVKITKEQNPKFADIDYKTVIEFLEVIIWPIAGKPLGKKY